MQNELLKKDILDLTKSPGTDLRIRLYRHLTQGILYLIVENLPEGFIDESTVIKKDTPLTILTTTMEGGGIAILAFTDFLSLNNYAPGSHHIAMQAEDVLKTVIDQGYDAVILNPAGPWAGVPREDVVKILEGGFRNARA